MPTLLQLENVDLRAGYLERRDDPSDMRSRRIHITARGKEVGRAMRDAVREVEREWEARLGPKRLDLLRDLLQELSKSGIIPR